MSAKARRKLLRAIERARFAEEQLARVSELLSEIVTNFEKQPRISGKKHPARTDRREASDRQSWTHAPAGTSPTVSPADLRHDPGGLAAEPRFGAGTPDRLRGSSTRPFSRGSLRPGCARRQHERRRPAADPRWRDRDSRFAGAGASHATMDIVAALCDGQSTLKRLQCPPGKGMRAAGGVDQSRVCRGISCRCTSWTIQGRRGGQVCSQRMGVDGWGGGSEYGVRASTRQVKRPALPILFVEQETAVFQVCPRSRTGERRRSRPPPWGQDGLLFLGSAAGGIAQRGSDRRCDGVGDGASPTGRGPGGGRLQTGVALVVPRVRRHREVARPDSNAVAGRIGGHVRREESPSAPAGPASRLAPRNRQNSSLIATGNAACAAAMDFCACAGFFRTEGKRRLRVEKCRGGPRLSQVISPIFFSGGLVVAHEQAGKRTPCIGPVPICSPL